MKIYLCMLCSLIVLLWLQMDTKAFAKTIVIDNYKEGISTKWKEKSIKGKTDYRLSYNDEIRCIQATSNSSASALYCKIDYDLNNYPFLSWQWKIDHILAKGNALKKEGCDFAARLYAVFQSAIPLKAKALSYIWASSLPMGKAVVHPYSKNTILLALQSGQDNCGKWILEKRNVLQDYHDIFGMGPPKVGAIAIMTDSDNTGESAIAWYGPIQIIGKH